MSYLSYHSMRLDPWREHDKFPKGAVKYWRESRLQWNEKYGAKPLHIFIVSEDHTEITLLPEEEWPV